MQPPPPFPWLFRFVNGLGALLDDVGLSPVRLEPARLVARAEAGTGLSDWGEPGWEAGLERLCRSAAEDAALTLVGRIALQDVVTEALMTRLRRVDAKKTRPEVFTSPLVPPLIVVGLPRSGTTHLHRLLVLAEDARPIPFWELRKPIAGPGPDNRRAIVAERFARIKVLAPEMDAKHRTGPDEPEECMMLLDSTLVSLTFWVFAPVYGYLEWLIDQDAAPLYRVYREHLQLLQAESPGKRLTLKAPSHTPFLVELLAAVPEAMIVQTHREPVTVVGSAASLFYTFHRMVTVEVDLPRLGASIADMMEQMLERNREAREQLPTGTVCDVRYDALVREPVEVVRRIYAHFGLPFDTAFEQRLRVAVAERPQHAHGVHEYALEDFGLDAATLAPRFDAYRERFLTG